MLYKNVGESKGHVENPPIFIQPEEFDNEEILKPKETLETPIKWCNVDLHTWFLIHSIVLTILNIPAILITLPILGLSVFPFTYTLILLTAAIWKKIPALQTVKVLAYFNLIVCILLLVLFPSIVTSMKGSYDYNSHEWLRRANFENVLRVSYTSFLCSIPIFVLIALFSVQLHIVKVVLEVEQRKVAGNLNAAANIA